MSKTLFILVFSLLSTSFFAQEKLKSNDISKFSHTFDIVNGNIIGAGATVLEEKILESQFFLLGEEHYSPEISELTNVLLPKLKQSDFNYFAIEVGPNSTEKIVSVIKKEHSLYKFNSDFYSKYQDIPIPFFDGKKDELFLKTALKENIEIWGIDQEFVSAHLFLIDEIYSLSNNKSLIQTEYNSVKRFIKEEYKKELDVKGYQMFENLLESTIIKTFFDKCPDVKQRKIIEDLIISWKIYAMREVKNYSQNNLTRMEYMKQQFGSYYNTASKTDTLSKIFIKMGSMHLARGQNWLGIYDLGNLIKELSYLNGTKSTSINCFSRYWKDDKGQVFDFLDEKEGKAYQPLLELAKKDKWVLIETKPILELIKKENIKLNKDLNILISGFDFILFSPTKSVVSLNYSE
ncbi:hypothetical protein [Olleya namhaensis]|uniref:Erythromycin esterase homolog n=1 Tax=Olleya namhaensis TaxID=1144750 RepID=A0A1I3QZ12_9FLAO|nr:hypothetical protein [Olleya namhaensis]SFJ39115.1 hypothetical protein SAMN05443431_10728 [Olleya namhaensis]